MGFAPVAAQMVAMPVSAMWLALVVYVTGGSGGGFQSLGKSVVHAEHRLGGEPFGDRCRADTEPHNLID